MEQGSNFQQMMQSREAQAMFRAMDIEADPPAPAEPRGAPAAGTFPAEAMKAVSEPEALPPPAEGAREEDTQPVSALRREQIGEYTEPAEPSVEPEPVLTPGEPDYRAGARRIATVMTVRLRNFRALVDDLPPKETFDTLCDYYATVAEVVGAHHGVMGQCCGESVTVIFGTEVGRPSPPMDAVQAAFALPRALRAFFLKMDEENGWLLGVGIGISAGLMVLCRAGDSGEEIWLALGDPVEESRFWEAATRDVPEEDSIVIGQAAYQPLAYELNVHELDASFACGGRTVQGHVVQGFRSASRAQPKTRRAA